MRAVRLLVLAVLATLAEAAAAQVGEPCMEAYNAELTRIEKDAKARQAVGSDAAKQRAARAAAGQERAAARRAQSCQAEAKKSGAAPKPLAETEGSCRDRANARAADLERRYAGRTLDGAEQNLRREEEIRLQAELVGCTRRGR